MQDFQKGLQQRLQEHVQELKTGKSNAAPAGGSSRSYFIQSLHMPIGFQDGMYPHVLLTYAWGLFAQTSPHPVH